MTILIVFPMTLIIGPQKTLIVVSKDASSHVGAIR
jgi:hypothetical protein